MSLIIDKATHADIPALAELLSELFTKEEEFKPDHSTQIKGLTAIISKPNTGTILVTKSSDKIIGMVNLLFTVSTALGERVALLEDMVVSASARQTGVGSKLLAEAISYAKSENCGRITLLTDQTNEAAQRFYQRHGFTFSSMIPMRLCF